MIFDTPEEVLEHFGVKGMKWGVRRQGNAGGYDASAKGETKSLRGKLADRNLRVNTERHAMLTARAAKADIRISELKAEIAALPKGVSARTRFDLNYEKNVTIAQRDKDLKRAQKPPSSGLTPTQKKVLIGAGVAAVVIGVHMAHRRGIDSEAVGAAIRRGESQMKYGDVFRPNPAFASRMTPEQVRSVVAAGVNPNYRSQGGAMNCRRATFAYEMRRRGYDVVATTSPVGYGQNESGLVNALTPGVRNRLSTQSMSSFASNFSSSGLRTRGARGDNRPNPAFTQSVRQLSELRSALSRHPNGARGEAVFDMGPFAHSMQWEIFDGVPHIFDSQKGTHYPTTPDGLRELMIKWGVPRTTEITRLDNVPLDMNFVGRWVRNS